MHKLSVFTLALAAVTVMALVTPAHADTTPGWYVGAGVGGTFTPDVTAKSGSSSTTVEFDPGWNVQGSGGYALENGLRFEGEVWHSRANVDKVKGSATSTGHLSNTDLFANALYDFSTGTMLTPY